MDLVDFHGFAVEADHVHDLHCVIGILLGLELHEAVSLVIRAHTVLGHEHVHCALSFVTRR